MRQHVVTGIAAAAAIMLPAAEAHARRGDDGRGVQTAVTVSRAQAVETARAQGVVRVREVKLREGRWKVEGWTDAGQAIEVEIHAGTGEVLKREIYR